MGVCLQASDFLGSRHFSFRNPYPPRFAHAAWKRSLGQWASLVPAPSSPSNTSPVSRHSIIDSPVFEAEKTQEKASPGRHRQAQPSTGRQVLICSPPPPTSPLAVFSVSSAAAHGFSQKPLTGCSSSAFSVSFSFCIGLSICSQPTPTPFPLPVLTRFSGFEHLL